MKRPILVLIITMIAGVLAAGCASSEKTASTSSSGPSASVATPDLTGSWSGRGGPQGREAPVALRLVQTGTTVSGDLQVSGRPDLSGPVRGTVNGNTVRLELGSGFAHSSALQVTSDASQITGNMVGSPVLLQRAK